MRKPTKNISETKQIMRRYTVVARVGEVPPGVTIELSPAQAASRIPYLEKLGDGIFRTSAMLQFMQGEEIGLTEVGMGTVHQLAIVEKEVPALILDPPPIIPEDLSQLTVKNLMVEIANYQPVEVLKGVKKVELIEILKAHREAAKAPAAPEENKAAEDNLLL
jgi:hypothetical protein